MAGTIQFAALAAKMATSERHKVLSAVLVTVAAGSLSNFAQTTLTHLATLRKAARPAQPRARRSTRIARS